MNHYEKSLDYSFDINAWDINDTLLYIEKRLLSDDQ